MKHIILLLAGLAITPYGAHADELFRWVDQDGKVHYGDVLPEGTLDVERKKLSDDQAQSANLPYETRRAQQDFPVTLYVSDGCGDACDQARSLLSKRGIPYSEKLLRTKQDVEALNQLSGIDSFVPVLQVGNDFLKGYLATQWNSELDIAGYPKTASYRQSALPATPPVPQPMTPASAVPATPPVPETPPADQAAPGEPAAQ